MTINRNEKTLNIKKITKYKKIKRHLRIINHVFTIHKRQCINVSQY